MGKGSGIRYAVFGSLIFCSLTSDLINFAINQVYPPMDYAPSGFVMIFRPIQIGIMPDSEKYAANRSANCFS